MNAEYCTIVQYMESKTTLIAKIQAYDSLITAMEATILAATTSGHLAEYEMDDGQMKVRARYRSLSEMNRALVGLEQIRQRYINRFNGRVTVLRGGNL